ncbi:MAG: hypothetical protein AAGN46_03850 [Acidobacteriota bacterium]
MNPPPSHESGRSLLDELSTSRRTSLERALASKRPLRGTGDHWLESLDRFAAARWEMREAVAASRRHLDRFARVARLYNAAGPDELRARTVQLYYQAMVARCGDGDLEVEEFERAIAGVKAFLTWARVVIAPDLPARAELDALLPLAAGRGLSQPSGPQDEAAAEVPPAPPRPRRVRRVPSASIRRRSTSQLEDALRSASVAALFRDVWLEPVEIAALRRADLHEERGGASRLTVAQGDGTARELRLDPAVAEILFAYLEVGERDLDGEGALILSHRSPAGDGLFEGTVRMILYKGLGSMRRTHGDGPGSWRLLFATRWLDEGRDAELLRQVLGDVTVTAAQRALAARA